MTEELHIRVPADLAEWIRREAEAEHRNINGQVNAMLALARSIMLDDQAQRNREAQAAAQRSTAS